MLHLLDIFFTLLHLAIILFNLFGWMFPKILKLHLIVALLTLGCWLILGIWYGIGYCPITDWQWQVKEKLGETNLPASFIKYFVDKQIGINSNPNFIDWVTGVGFGLAVITTVYLNIKTVVKHKDRLAS